MGTRERFMRLCAICIVIICLTGCGAAGESPVTLQQEETSAIVQEMTSEAAQETQTEVTTEDGESDIQTNTVDFLDAAEREALYDQDAMKAYQAFLNGGKASII